MADKKPLTVVVICGSLRNKSYNHALAQALPGLAPAGMTIKDTPPWSSIPFYNQDIQDASGFPPAAEDLATAVRAADGVIIVSPEYNWTIPGGLKNAFDWLSRMKDQPFKDKPVALQSASQGPLGGGRMQYHLRMCMTYMGCFLFGTPEIFVGMAQNKFDKESMALTDQATKDIIKKQLEGFAAFIDRVRA
jgi:chromate reductase